MQKSLFLTYIFSFFTVVCFGNSLKEAVIVDSTKIEKGFDLKYLPVIYYLPETSFAFGAAGVATFRFSNQQKRASVIQFAGLYTLKRQLILSSSFDFFAKGEDWRFIGELSYYNYFYNFYGIGKETKKENFERFKLSYPRFRVGAYKKVKEELKVGLLYQFEGITSVGYEKGGLIDKSDYVGKEGGIISNLGFGVLYDNRDNIISAREGSFVEFQYHKSNKIFLSAFNYHRLSADYRYYMTPFSNITFAANVYAGHMYGTVPFYDMFAIGSDSHARGTSDRRFKDKTVMLAQLEARIPIHTRVRLNAFVSTASVGNGIVSTFKNRYTKSYGLGLRYILNKKDLSMLRVDLARDREGFNFYFTAGEAF